MKEQDLTKPAWKDGKPADAGARPASGMKAHPILTLCAVLCVALCAWFLFRLFTKPKAKPPAFAGIPVSTGRARVGDINIYLDALGTVTPVNTVTVTSRVAGELTAVLYTEGQMVKKNDLLAVIDPRPYQALLVQAHGQLARDEALLKNARLDLVRYQNAYEQHAIPEQQLATQQALVDQDSGAVELDQGNLAAAQVNVDYTRITSPIDGRVGLRSVDPGNLVAAGGSTPLAVITQLQPITVVFTISEDDLTRVTEQTSAGRTLSVSALDRAQQHRIAEGTLLTLDNQINTATGTVKARATFPNLKSELFPNQFVNVRLLVKTLSKVNLVPAASVQRNGDVAFVYVVQPDGTVKSVDVKVVATEAESTAVTGVAPGDELVTDGFDKLQSGTKIVVRTAPSAAAPEAAAATPTPAHE
jgi:multidrug efflux system membrane fusion protein